MRALSTTQLLDAWEQGLNRRLAYRVLTLLAAACPECTLDELATLAIGQRDARLLQLRQLLFGSELSIVAPCPACGEHLETAFSVGDIRLDAEPSSIPNEALTIDGYRLIFRLPASQDLLDIADAQTEQAARLALFARCLLEARDADGKTVSAASLPEHVVGAVARQMSQADPQAHVELAMACPACGHNWQVLFDIASFLWREVHAWVQRTVRDVDALARAYGWREADILALSPSRRQLYLELSRQ